MPQGPQFVVVEVPGVGNVEFPSTMGQTAIAQAAAKLHRDAQQQQPAASAPEMDMSAAPDLGGSLKRFLGGAAETMLPSTTPGDYLEGPAYALQHPIDSLSLILGALKNAHVAEAQKTAQAAREGRYSEMVGHGLATVLPVVGPAAAAAGERIGSGDVAGGLGMGAGLLAPMAASHLPATAAVRVPGVGATANPAEAAALQFARDRSIPLDAATASGSPFVRRVQTRLGNTVGASGVVRGARAAQEAALERVGKEISNDVHPVGVDPVTAGERVRASLESDIRGHHDMANQQYERLRGIEADPQFAREIATAPAPDSPGAAMGRQVPGPDGRFAKGGASIEDLFQGVLGDARNNGFRGSADDLRTEFYQRVKSARSLGEDMAAGQNETGPRALLADIRKLGGLKPTYRDLDGSIRKGDLSSVLESFSSRNGWGQSGGGGIARATGLGVDDMMDQLKQDPKWRGVFGPDATDHDLVEALNDIAHQGPGAAGAADVEHLLKGAGVEPGAKWWSRGAEKTETVALPVDLRAAKTALQPIYDRLTRLYPVAQRQASKGYQAIENIVKGRDYEPLSVADDNLSAIKSIARGADMPELRSTAQGLAAKAVKELDAAVRKAAEGAGPDATEALEGGRLATREKFGVSEVLDQLSTEPRRVFDQLTVQKDAGLERLKAVQSKAPAQVPEVARAVLEELMNRATAEGGFRHTDRVYADWQKLGDRTKDVLFPQHRADLDRFFLLAKKMGENPNPSGTAGQLSLFNVWASVPANVLARMLYSKGGVDRLVNGLRVQLPKGSRAFGNTSAAAGRLQAASEPQ